MPRKRSTISIVQYLVRLDRLMHGNRHLRSVDILWDRLSDEDKVRLLSLRNPSHKAAYEDTYGVSLQPVRKEVPDANYYNREQE